MPAFIGQLRSNEIFSAIYNMIISQEVFADNIKGDDLVDKARVDGGLYGDQKLYYSTDALESHEWGMDAEATNLLAPKRPEAPKVQAIILDKFRQIDLTIDNYMTKRAFSDEGTFASFNGVMLGWLRDTKKVYDGTMYNCYIGTVEGDANKKDLEVDLAEGGNSTGENLANAIANLFTEMEDYTRDFNDYKQLRRYSRNDVKIVWNAKYVNAVKNIDLPSIFHNEELKDKFVGDVLPARYFGEVNASATAGDGSTVRSLIEQVIGTGANAKHYFAGDLIAVGQTAPAGTSYTEDADIIAKVFVKLPPYMSAFEVGTSFFNPKALLENHYLTWGHNTLEYLKAYPVVKVYAKASA